MDFDSNIFGMPLPYEARNDALILEIHDSKTGVMQFLESSLGINAAQILRLFSSQSKSVYDITQHVSQEAFKSGFDGIAYKSARTTQDVQIIGHNLVLFFENKVSRFRLKP